MLWVDYFEVIKEFESKVRILLEEKDVLEIEIKSYGDGLREEDFEE